MPPCDRMVLPQYLSSVVKEMRERSAAIRRDFAVHHLSAGENREDLVAGFLKRHLPRKFGVSRGMIISHDGAFSNQADLVVVDKQNNAPLYASSRNKLWPVEAVYALIEVKTTLTPTELSDAIAKGRKFKSLARKFAGPMAIGDSLFVIWAFDSASATTFKSNLIAALASVPRAEQPDFIVVPDKLIACAGTYVELSILGQPNSTRRLQLNAQFGPDLDALIAEPSVFDFGENALLGWYVWFDSWLRRAGSRLTEPAFYLPPDEIFGHKV